MNCSATPAKGQYLAKLNKHYNDMPATLKRFCDLFLEQLNYNTLTTRFAASHPVGQDCHDLWIKLISKLLNTTMTWPDDSNIPDRKVDQLPDEDKELVIDYTGYLIGLPQGHGDSLIGIYKQYFNRK